MKNQYVNSTKCTESSNFLLGFKGVLRALKKRRNSLGFGLLFVVVSVPGFTQNQTVSPGGTAIFSTFGGDYNIQWRFSVNGNSYQLIPGETGSTLTITNVQESNQGYYAYSYSYRCGFGRTCTGFSTRGYLTVSLPIQITQQPEGQAVVCEGGSAMATVVASGATEFQWYKNNPNTTDEVSGQNMATLSLNALQPANSGNYYCRVSGDGGVVWSNAFALTVNEAATASPITAGASAICQNGTTTFNSSWGGAATFGGFTDGGLGGTFTTLSQVDNGISVSYKPPLNYTGPITISFVTTDPPGPCSYVTTTTSLTVNALPSVSITGLGADYCQNAAAVALTGSPANGSFTVDTNPATHFDPALLTVGNHTVNYTYTDPTTMCSNSVSQSVEIIAPVFTQAATLTAVPVCAGQTVSLSFNVNCPTNSTFIAELSNASGNFPGYTFLGTINPGSTTLTIPAGTVAGTGYKIKVTSTNPALSSTTDGFTVIAPSFTSTPTVSGVPVCLGSTVTVNFSTSCPAGSLFALQLSNANGSFASPTALGTFSAGSPSVVIPSLVPAGSGYRIRAVSPGGGPTSNPSAAFRARTCGSRLAAEASAEDGTGLQVHVSPNPTEGLLRIHVGGTTGQALKVELFNGAGQSIRQQSFKQAQAEESLIWDLARQPQGLYLLRVSTDREAKTIKVVH